MVNVLADIITEESYKSKQIIFTSISFNKYYDSLKVRCVHDRLTH